MTWLIEHQVPQTPPDESWLNESMADFRRSQNASTAGAFWCGVNV